MKIARKNHEARGRFAPKTCKYNKTSHIEATANCFICGAGLCSSCGYTNQYNQSFCNECNENKGSNIL